MMKLLFALISGMMFGFGISLAGMTNPDIVIQFLDITGNWNPALLLVLGAALSTTAIGYALVLRRKAPVCDVQFHLPQQSTIDRDLILGSAIFGIGWGMAGYCPGAALAALAAPNQEIITFISAMLMGMVAHQKLK